MHFTCISLAKLRQAIRHLVLPGPVKALLDQQFLFSGGASGISKKGLACPVLTKNHRIRNSSTFFFTLVTAFSPSQAMGM